MEASIIKNELMQRRTVYDGSCEIGVESDIVLPDYCGDIERILKCSLMPRASSKRIEGQRLSVGGMAFLRMVYLSPNGRVESFETQIPFSKSIEMPSGGENPSISVRFETEYSNCHAISPRRFELRGALSMKARVRVCAPVSVVTDIVNEGVEVKRKKFEAVVPVSSACESFTVMEEYELSTAPISSVVRMTANPKILEHKIVSGKVIMKGEIALTVIYLCEDSEQTQSAQYTIPVNQVLSADGAEEGDSAELRLEISRMSAEPISHGDNNEIAVEVLLEASADISRRVWTDAVVDAYCIGRESACGKSETALCTMEETAERTHQMCITPDSADIHEILDVFADVKNTGASVNDQGEIMLRADVTVGVLSKNGEGEVFVCEKTAPAEISVSADRRFSGSYIDGEMSVLSASRGSNKNEVCVLLSARCRILKNENFSFVNSMDISSEVGMPADPKTALTIYFAEAGEDAFDIAKRYNTSARAVMEENNLEDTTVPKAQKILIPMVK